MTDDLTRDPNTGRWPRQLPIFTVSVWLIASAAAVSVIQVRNAQLEPLQRAYLSGYLKSAFANSVGLPPSNYLVLMTGDRLVAPPEVIALPDGELSISAAGFANNISAIAWKAMKYRHDEMYAWLRGGIFEGRSVWSVFRPSVVIWLLIGLVGSAFTVPKDRTRARERRQGIWRRGAIEQPVEGDGIGIMSTPQPSVSVSRAEFVPNVRIPASDESSHILVMSDIGGGKSNVFSQLLTQIATRGETAIIYDPHHEYVSRFYQPERLDVILNPLDARSPFWSPGEEVMHESEALTFASALFPDKHTRDSTFFTEGPRRIFAHLLTFKPTAHQLALWLRDERLLDDKLFGTPYATIIDANAPAQRAGILAALNMVADTLTLLPGPHETGGDCWQASSWSKERTGWLFLTSTPATRQRLLPLISLWLDTLILRSMEKHDRPLWFFIDELPTLNRLPQLHTALTETRKFNVRFVLGFQGRSQIEQRYGGDADTLLSQPKTKVFFRTSDPRSAKWVSEAIGEREIERLHESRSKGNTSSQSFELNRSVEPIALPSEIEGWPNRTGMLRHERSVVRLNMPYLVLPNIADGFIARTTSHAIMEPVPVATPDAATGASQSFEVF